MKKIIFCGKRPALLTFIAIIFALLFVYGFYSGKIYVSVLAVGVIIALFACASLNHFKKLLLLFMVAFTAFVAYGFAVFESYNSVNIDPEATYTITGKVPTIINDDGVSCNFILRNCTIVNTKDSKQVLSNINIRIVQNAELALNAGDIVIFEGNLQKIDLFSFGKINSYSLPSNIYATCFASGDYTVIGNEINLRDIVHLKVKDAYYSTMDDDVASVAFACIFGDQSGINQTIMDGFRNSGLAHILSVSGLHTTILFTMLAWVFSKFKRIKREVVTVILACVLLLYSYLCDFNPCIIRASIMGIVYYLGLTCHQHSDMLNSIGVSGCIVLAVNPLDLFNLGFCLSFSCMYGIGLLGIAWQNKLKDKRFGNFTSTIAMIVATQLASVPFLAYYFGYFTFIGFIGNILLLPLFNIAFVILLVLLIPTIICPPTLLLSGLGVLIGVFIDASVAISNLDFLIVPLCKIGLVGILAYLFLLFALTNKCFVQKRAKVVLNACVVLVIALSLLVANLPSTQLNTTYRVEDTSNTYYLKLGKDNLCFVNPFSSSSTLNATKEKLFQINERKIEHLIQLSPISVGADKVECFLEEYSISVMYLPNYLYDENSYIIQLLQKSCDFRFMEDMQAVDIGTPAKFIRTTIDEGYIKYIIADKQYIITS